MSDDLVLPGIVIPTDKAQASVQSLKQSLLELVETSKQGAGAAQEIGQTLTATWETLGATIAFDKVKEFVGEIVSASERAEQAQLKLAGVLHATGNASGVTAAQVNQLSEELQKNTLFKSEEIQNAASVLATYTHVQGEHFTQAIKLSADLASLMGGDVTGAARQLGRALEDPEHGLMALRRAGIVFTQSEREHIKAMQDAGDMYGAQGVVLDHLAGRVEGLAEKMHGGLMGAITDTKHAWDDFLAGLGQGQGVIAETLQAGARALTLALHAATTPSTRRGQLQESLAREEHIFHEGGWALSGTYSDMLASMQATPGGTAGFNAPEYETLKSIVGLQGQLGDLDKADANDLANAKKAAKTDEQTNETANSTKAVDDYVDSIKQQIAALQGVTKEQQDFNEALEAAHDAAQRRQVIGAYNAYGVASLGAMKWSSLTGDITDPGLRSTAHIENEAEMPPWMGGQGFSDSSLANAGGGRNDGLTLDQRLQAAQRQAQQTERAIAAQQQRAMQQQQEMWVRLSEGMSGTFVRVFDSVLQGRVRSFQQFTRQILLDWSNMLGQMAARQGGAAIAKSILGAFGTSASAPGADVSTIGPIDAGSGLNVSEFHSGGIVGDDGVSRAILSSLFSGAPRFHDGLAPDEFPAVLQRGEGVFTQSQMAAMGGNDVHVHYHVNAIDSRDVADFFEQNRHHVAAAVSDAVLHSSGVRRVVRGR